MTMYQKATSFLDISDSVQKSKLLEGGPVYITKHMTPLFVG